MMPRFHICIVKSGLGIPCFQLWIPFLRSERLTRISQNENDVIQAIRQCALYKSIIQKCNPSLTVLREEPTKGEYHTYWINQQMSKVDRKDLEHAGVHKSTTSWNSLRMDAISGEDYVHYHMIITNSLPTRMRTARGRKANGL